MSLENKIEELNASIQKLIEVISSNNEVSVTSAKAPNTPEVEEPEQAKSASLSFTHEDLKEELMKAARRGRKAECAALLGEYGAKKVTQVADSDLEIIINKAKEL